MKELKAVKKKPVTLKDVAEHLGVSITVVSLVVNKGKGYERISQETCERVHAACEELGYRPNYFAQRLKKNQTRQIAAMVPSLYNPFTPPLIDGMKSVLLRNDYNLLIFDSEASDNISPLQTARGQMEKLLAGGIDGVISHIGHQQVEELVHGQVPIVHIDEDLDITPGVSVDVIKAVEQLTELFVRQGCDRIAYIGARGREAFQYTFNGRQRGYEMALEKGGIPVDPSIMKHVVPTLEGGHEAFEWLIRLSPRPRAVVVYTDIVAHVVQARLVQNGVRIPDEIAIASLDDTYPSALMTPPLTAVHIPAFEIGAAAAKLMVDTLEGKNTTGQHIRLETTLHERGSSQIR